MMMRGPGKVWSSLLLLKGERERGRINRAALRYKVIEWKVMERTEEKKQTVLLASGERLRISRNVFRVFPRFLLCTFLGWFSCFSRLVFY